MAPKCGFTRTRTFVPSCRSFPIENFGSGVRSDLPVLTCFLIQFLPMVDHVGASWTILLRRSKEIILTKKNPMRIHLRGLCILEQLGFQLLLVLQTPLIESKNIVSQRGRLRHMYGFAGPFGRR